MPSKTPRIRNLGQIGVITDIDPYDLPPNALSFGKNIRFKNNKVQTGPCFKTALSPLREAEPRYVTAFLSSINETDTYIGYLDGSVSNYANGVETNYSPTCSFTGSISGNTLDITAVSAGSISLGMSLNRGTAGTTITGFATAVFAGSISGTALTISSLTSGTVAVGMTLSDPSGQIPLGVTIVSGSGTSWVISESLNIASDTITAAFVGGVGLYTVNISQTLASGATVATYTTASNEETWSSALLGELNYVNRSDRPPWWIGQSNSFFQSIESPLVGQWQPTWTCGLLRANGGALIAMNLVMNGVAMPTAILTSSFAAANNIPASWNYDDPEDDATLNTLAEMEGEIVDACQLGQNLVIYSNTQTWLQTPDLYSGNIWDYVQLPFQKGCINANCSVEVNAQNYVFGMNDIWVHDGVTEQSVCDQRVREFIFSSINMSFANRCFVLHNLEQKEIGFYFVSGDGYCAFPYSTNVTSGCNRGAIYSYATNTWSFDDVPRVFSACRTNLDVTTTWASETSTWADKSATWQSQADTAKRCAAFVGDTSSNDGLTCGLYAFDPFGTGGVTSLPVNTAATSFPYGERQGISLDDIGASLQSYKQVNYLIPQGRIDTTSTQMIMFSVGISDGYNDVVEWSPYAGYDGGVNNIIDARAAGKYLSVRIAFNDYRQFTLSGFDIDVMETGQWR